ncbi:MAG: hypothetical protein JNL38_22480 [Myxococcales bacterium]|nr:hypothetical protein [Myxococcales bacterium]
MVPLPSLEGARDELGPLVSRVGWPFGKDVDLWTETPTAVMKLAAVLVSGRATRRDSWSEDVEISEALFAKLAAEPPIEPPKGTEPREQRRLDGASAIRAVCTHCGVRPGLGPCPRCTGTGRLLLPGDDGGGAARDCPDCDRGFVTCTVCEGTRAMVKAKLLHVTDHVVALHQLVLPDLPEWLEDPVRDMFAGAGDGLPEHAHDPEPSFTAAAYRGAQAASEQSFHGFAFGKANAAANELRARFAYGEGTSGASVKCYARPFLVARYHLRGVDRTVVVLLDSVRAHVARVIEDTYGNLG